MLLALICGSPRSQCVCKPVWHSVDRNAPTAGATNAISDVLNINYFIPDSRANYPSVVATEDASTIKDCPVGSGAFYAYRLALPITGTSPGQKYKVVVVLFEAYPSPGRIWTNAYNPDSGNWGAWTSR